MVRYLPSYSILELVINIIKKLAEILNRFYTIIMENNSIETAQTISQNNLAVPIAIIIAGLAIAAAVYFGGSKERVTPSAREQGVVIAPVTTDDHILGNPNATVVIIEYSDTECPFCKIFHATMGRVMNEYGDGGKVAWVYRHSPIASLHSKAHREAQATECAASLGGNTKFWDYTNKLFDITPSGNGLKDEELFTIAQNVGLDKEAFSTCLEGGSQAARVDRDLASGQEAGVRGTPHSLVLVDGKLVTRIEGANTYESVKNIVDQYLAH